MRRGKEKEGLGEEMHVCGGGGCKAKRGTGLDVVMKSWT